MEDKKKKILFLGGADIQISAIKKAVEMGYYVITCDYLPNNPGHKFSHAYYNVSTTDKEAVLKLAQQLKIDGISAYAADPAALTAAYVSEIMGLPGNSFAAVSILADKHSFRTAQLECGILTPIFFLIKTADDIIKYLPNFPYGGILKPVDTSGSKGVHKIESKDISSPPSIKALLDEALHYSRSKRIIFEEYIPRKGFLMGGDFFIDSGKITFYCFGDVHFNTRINGLVPRSVSFPASKPVVFFEKIVSDIQKVISYLNINTGVFNVDFIENEKGEPVIIDIGARNGGNMLNDIIFYHAGINLIEGSIHQSMGEEYHIHYSGEILGYYAHNVLHSEKDGIFDYVEFSKKIEKCIIYKSINPKSGDKVFRFINTTFRIGLLLLKFETFNEMHEILSHIEEHVIIHLKNT